MFPMRASRLADACEKAVGIRPTVDYPGSELTTFAIGGSIPFYLDVDSVDELKALLVFFKERGISYRVLGNGSNLLIPDEGITSWILHLGRAFRFSEKTGESSFTAGAATPLMTISRRFSDDGYSGLEFAAGIPGSIGGAVRMNAGAHGSCMGEIIKSVRMLIPSGEVVEVERKDLTFHYRDSGITEGTIVLSAELELAQSDKTATRRRRQEMLAERKAHQPLQFPSAGSTFRNPLPDKPAGMLIEGAGLKGYRIGGAEVSQLHANWIINPDKQATAADVKKLMELCQRRVHDLAALTLEPEVVMW